MTKDTATTIELLHQAVSELRDVTLKHMEAAQLPENERHEFIRNTFVNFFTYMMAQCVHASVPKKKRDDFISQVFIQARQKINIAVNNYDEEEAQCAEDNKQQPTHIH